MIYNEFKGEKLSRLGFGCMRFASDQSTGEIDQAKVDAMFDLAIANGINYFDTAYPYLNGKSEGAMAKALSRYHRDSYYVADKFPGHSLPGPVDNVALFEISRKRCGVDYFDFYLLHNVTESTVDIYESEEYHIIPDILKMKAEGKIKHLGFSCHGGADLLDAFLTRHEGVFEFVQIQCNYLDWTLQNAKKKYDVITKHGLGVWVMEPVRGGKLSALPAEASEKLKQIAGQTEASDASFAFRFLQDLPDVKMILSGMNEVFQVEDNCKTFAEHMPLTERERKTLMEISESLKQGVPCTGCRYCCGGCPLDLDIPFFMECYNDNKFAPGMTASMRIDGLPENKRPAACIACGQCASACPQGIDCPSVIGELSEMYEKGPKWAVMSKGRQEAILKDLGRTVEEN